MNRRMIKDTYRQFLRWKVCDKHAVTVDCIRQAAARTRTAASQSPAAVWAFMSEQLWKLDVFLCWTFTRVSFVIRHNLFLLKYFEIHTSS